jgi:hypothetical protein
MKPLPIMLVLLTLMSCSSEPVNIQNKNTDNTGTVLKRVTGKACGSKILSVPGAMALDFIPIMFNNRLERAMQEAMFSAPDIKSLKNVEIEETWFYWVLGQTRCVIVTGDAVL